jgi:hypothetical protein
MVSPSDRDDWLRDAGGRLHGIVAVLLALAETHPEPKALLDALERIEQVALATVESTLASDHYIDGTRDVIDRVRELLRLRLESEAD